MKSTCTSQWIDQIVYWNIFGSLGINCALYAGPMIVCATAFIRCLMNSGPNNRYFWKERAKLAPRTGGANVTKCEDSFRVDKSIISAKLLENAWCSTTTPKEWVTKWTVLVPIGVCRVSLSCWTCESTASNNDCACPAMVSVRIG